MNNEDSKKRKNGKTKTKSYAGIKRQILKMCFTTSSQHEQWGGCVTFFIHQLRRHSILWHLLGGSGVSYARRKVHSGVVGHFKVAQEKKSTNA